MYDFDTEVPSARDFLERELKAEPAATYSELRDRAARLGLNVPPFLYGNARRQLGLPPKPPDALPERDSPRFAAGEPARRRLTETGPGQAAEPVTDVESSGSAASVSVATAPAVSPATVEPEAPDVAPRPRPGKSGFDFAVEMLRLTPEISFQDLRDRARLAGLNLPPIVYGRAKALLGLVPTKPRRRREPPAVAPRTLRQVDSALSLQPAPDLGGVRQLEQLVATVRTLEAQNRRLLSAVQAAMALTTAALDDRGDG
jgi:hypothetical protein